ncbi:adenosylcobinamide-phosphate synthase [Caloranaerobacter azorensis DSM 13643]|uniref:Cobalamin biosynthesis protein CobD n=1 Tax=Caloranaerobacter azorensis DSM 13643 TaxID=1121264 RepID=A0A1M5R8M1_9FIRM|nr:adenosylcobinamide-phosphate synthase CbiB [Caloranaerobacter azorensis]SHH22571.1 adenosylcobinamide-phosphate synthase [Caloranaerobacter azorensis DSM 13643]
MGIYILIIAVVLDYIIGDPNNWPHPIRYIGRLITRYEKVIRKSKVLSGEKGGFVLTFATLATVLIIIHYLIRFTYIVHFELGFIFSVYLIYTSIAARCLDRETMKVYYALKEDNITKARQLLSYLVGRETSQLQKKEIIRATVETIAENTIDGVIAPLMFIGVGLVLGIPVEMAYFYKTVNTLDSMVGYIQEPYREIGYASAKLDDLVNYIPARIGSLLMLIAGFLLGYDLRNGYMILKRDKRNHKSPNSGYSEAAVAGLLNVQLGGTNIYFGQKVYKPTIGDKNRELSIINIKDAIKIMYASEILLIVIIILIFVLL